MSKMILGIDPGSQGALVFYDGNSMSVYDMPVHEIKKGKGKRKRLDPYGLCDVLKKHKCDHAYVEQVSAQPGNGIAQAFTFGWMCGGLEVALVGCGVSFTYVTPQKWKGVLKCPKEKDGARMRASQLMPMFAHQWHLKKHDGRAEAALIAYYGMHE